MQQYIPKKVDNEKTLPFLSKSRYLNGLQCEKLLWYAINNKRAFPPVDDAKQILFDEGKRVGEFAQKMFPGGNKVAFEWAPGQMHAKSVKTLEMRKPLFEAGFVFKRAYALADILAPTENGSWNLYEVKSTTSVKDEHKNDLAFQKYTYDNAGVKIQKCFLMYINNQYVKKGNIKPEELFISQDMTEITNELKKDVEEKLGHMLEIIALNEAPIVTIGPQCDTPYECPLKGICWKFLPEKDNVFVLLRGKKLAFELVDMGVTDIFSIPTEVELTINQLAQIKSHKTGTPHIKKKELQEFLGKMEYPLYFLDFETIGPAIPVYDLSSPYEQVPFQFSLHIKETEQATEPFPATTFGGSGSGQGQPKHFSYLAPGRPLNHSQAQVQGEPLNHSQAQVQGKDPRPEILKRLKELLGSKGSIVAYYAPFEIKALEKAVAAYPEFSEWFETIKIRFVDLIEPFKQFYYYHPGQKGSNSIKSVLPAITMTSYDDLQIRDGSQASREYYKITFDAKVPDTEVQRVRQALEKYCALDTQAMVDILEKLKNSVK